MLHLRFSPTILYSEVMKTDLSNLDQPQQGFLLKIDKKSMKIRHKYLLSKSDLQLDLAKLGSQGHSTESYKIMNPIFCIYIFMKSTYFPSCLA